MSTLFRDNQGKLLESWLVFGFVGSTSDCCDVCGEKADAVWHGKRMILICSRCSLNALPALIADAMRAHGRDSHLLLETKRMMVERYFETAAQALAHRRPKKKKLERAEREGEVVRRALDDHAMRRAKKKAAREAATDVPENGEA
jgi:hypothetical protein